MLYQHGFPVPVPIAQARHCIVMSLIDSFPLYVVRLPYSPSLSVFVLLMHLDFPHPHHHIFEVADLLRRQVESVDSPSDLYATLMALILRLARSGLIHGDFNEFNILIRRKTGDAVLIDFPQMVSTRHENAE